MTKTKILHQYFGTSWWVTVAQGFPFQEHLTTAQDSMSNSRLFCAKLNNIYRKDMFRYSCFFISKYNG